MTKYLLDTNIVSEATRPRPSEALTRWLARQPDSRLFIATLTLGEIGRGILEKPPGRKRTELEAWFSGAEGPSALFRGRVLAFDEAAALEWAKLMAAGRTQGEPRSALDMVIAATAAANGCTVVSGNERHFRGVVKLINPLGY